MGSAAVAASRWAADAAAVARRVCGDGRAWRARRWMRLVPAVAAAVTACGSAAPPAPVLHRQSPLTYLLRLDDMAVPGFVALTAPHQADAAELAAGDPTVVRQLTDAGLQAAAEVHLYRQTADAATANGPLDVIATVERYGDAAAAHRGFVVESARLDAALGAIGVSTGDLGDEHHATSTEQSAASLGVTLVQEAVVWRVDDLVDVLVVRGRAGGLDMADAVTLARRQTAHQR